MAEVADRRRNLARRKIGQLPPADAHRSFIRTLAKEHASQRGFATGYRAGHADDIARLCGERQVFKDRIAAVIGEGQMTGLHRLRGRQGERLKRLLRFHHGLDALPRNLRALHGVEQFRRLGGLGRHLRKAGEERRKRRDIPRAPARAQHVFRAEPENKRHAQVGDHQIERRQRGLPDVGAHGVFLVIGQRLFIPRFPHILAAVYAVGDGVFRPAERRRAERRGRLFIGRARTLNRLFHQLCADIGNRHEDHT